MKIFKIIIVILFITNCLFGQGVEHNLDKYWYYKKRLEDRFMLVSSGNEQGSNLPMARIGHRYDTGILDWGDANGEMPYYLEVLATEYKLLKEYGQDCSGTLNRLVYALRAVDRIDKNAEKHWRGGSALSSDLNGFFIRDDVDEEFAQRWGNSTNNWGDKMILSGFVEVDVNGNYIDKEPSEMSQDVVWNYLPNLALIKKLVDEPTLYTDGSGEQVTIKEWAQKIAYRMINQLHHSVCIAGTYVYCGTWDEPFKFCWHCTAWAEYWTNKNPVTGENVEAGADATLFQSLFAEAGNWITDEKWGNMHTTSSSLFLNTSIEMGNATLSLSLAEVYNLLTENNVSDYNYRALMTVMGEEGLNENDKFYYDLCFLRNLHIVTDLPLLYEHFPLIFLTLHGGYDDEYYNEYFKNFYISLLDEAPDCGPYDLGGNNQTDWSPTWSTNNRLVWPEMCNDTNTWFNGEYNGLDYLLLHNLFWLTYIDKYPQNKLLSVDFPTNYNYGSGVFPANINASNKIIANNNIDSNGDVTYTAGTEVVLLPGFETEAGANFEAVSLGLHNSNNFVYKKTNYIPECSEEKRIINNNDSIYVKSRNIKNISDDCRQTSPNVDKEVIADDKSIDKTTDVNELFQTSNKFTLFPNPANQTVNLAINSEGIESVVCSVRDIYGKEYYNKQLNVSSEYFKTEINLSNFPKGIYFVNIRGKDFSETKKLIVQ